jgi:hypothetical protein
MRIRSSSKLLAPPTGRPLLLLLTPLLSRVA